MQKHSFYMVKAMLSLTNSYALINRELCFSNLKAMLSKTSVISKWHLGGVLWHYF